MMRLILNGLIYLDAGPMIEIPLMRYMIPSVLTRAHSYQLGASEQKDQVIGSSMEKSISKENRKAAYRYRDQALLNQCTLREVGTSN